MLSLPQRDIFAQKTPFQVIYNGGIFCAKIAHEMLCRLIGWIGLDQAAEKKNLRVRTEEGQSGALTFAGCKLVLWR